MKFTGLKFSILAAGVLAFCAASSAWATTTDTATATATADLSVTVVTPLTLTCPTAAGAGATAFQVVANSSASKTSAAIPITCTTNGISVAWTEIKLQAQLVADLADSATPADTISASNVAVSQSGTGSWLPLNTSSPVTAYDDTTTGATVTSSLPFFVQVTVPKDTPAATYTGTMDMTLTVTYTP